MLLPIGDDNSDRTLTPFVNYLLIALNVFVFIYYQAMGHDSTFTYAFVTVPAEILTGHDIVTADQTFRDAASGQLFKVPGLGVTPVPVFLTIFTAMFMHGGWAHLLGNMLYLWIFGDNLENRMGHARYLGFYLACGVIATLAHIAATVFFGQNAYIPSLGASGAISGVLGGYILLFPKRKVKALFLGIFFVTVPSILALGLWILFQVFSGIGSLQGAGGGVAYAAHIGGFIAGLVLVRMFDRGGSVRVASRR
jgi:membrane associated rhomboid family serine protease